MKIKFTWPMGIVIALVSFIVFILSFVYKAHFVNKYDHHLVSEDYYKDELNYQNEINEQNRGIALKENVSIKKTSEGLLILFPKEFNPSTISGTIYFQRLSNDKIDFNLPIKLETNEFLIKNETLVEGRWDIKIAWQQAENKYLFKEKIMY